MFNLNFLKAYKNQICHTSDLGAPTDKVICPFDHVIVRCHVTKKHFISHSTRLVSIKLGTVVT